MVCAGGVFFRALASSIITATPEAPSLAPMMGLLFIIRLASISARGRVSQWAQKTAGFRFGSLPGTVAMILVRFTGLPVVISLWAKVWSRADRPKLLKWAEK